MPGLVTAATSFVFFGTTSATLTFFGSTALWNGFASIVGGAILTAVSGVRVPDGQTAPGIRTPFIGRGETRPQSIIVGRTATSGHALCPQMSHNNPNIDGTRYDYLNGQWGGPIGTGNWLTYVINLSDAPITALEKVYCNGTEFNFLSDLTSVSPTYGRYVASDHPDLAEWHERIFVKFYDGTQTAADPYLLAAYGNHPDRPWKATHVHKGGAYVIVTVQRDDNVFSRPPEFRFQVQGIPLRDDRDNSDAYSNNAPLIAWNIATGINLPDGDRWGLGFDADDLPDTDWHDGMDIADLLLANVDGAPSENQYVAGLEIPMATPRDGGIDASTALDDILAAAAAEVADVGGTLRIRVGGPGLPVISITDDDVLNSREQSYTPFEGIDNTFNGVSAIYPDPEARWEPVSAGVVLDKDQVADDGEQLVASLQLDAVPSSRQVQRLTSAWLKDAQRRRTHSIFLAPWFDMVEPLDTIQLTSEIHNYTNKLFEVQEYEADMQTGVIRLIIREVDPNDYVPIETEARFVNPSRQVPAVPVIESWSLTSDVIEDEVNGRQGYLEFDPIVTDSRVEGIEYVVTYRGQEVASGYNAGTGSFRITQGILPGEEYTGTIRPYQHKVAFEYEPVQTVTTPRWYLTPQEIGDAGRASDVRLRRLEEALLQGTLAQEVQRNALAAAQANRSAEIDQRLRVEINDRQALAAVVTDLSTTVGGNSTSISESLITLDGILSQYAVIVDNNGVASGFALISELISGSVQSAFKVQADSFQITTPDGDIPVFTFYATPTVVDGVTRQGLYITGDMGISGDLIQDGTILRKYQADYSGAIADGTTYASMLIDVQPGEVCVKYGISFEEPFQINPEDTQVTWAVEQVSPRFSDRVMAGRKTIIPTSQGSTQSAYENGVFFEIRDIDVDTEFRIRIDTVDFLWAGAQANGLTMNMAATLVAEQTWVNPNK
ncbi:MAG: phage tail protein [Pseudomonadota bacterium]